MSQNCGAISEGLLELCCTGIRAAVGCCETVAVQQRVVYMLAVSVTVVCDTISTSQAASGL